MSTRYRVRVRHAGRVTHDSTFATEARARDYLAALVVPGRKSVEPVAMAKAEKPNAIRRAKMRTLTLGDAAWAELGRRAEAAGVSRSALVEAWLSR